MNDKDLEWSMISLDHVINDEYIDLRRMGFKLPDGQEFAPFYNYTRRDYVVIVATDELGRYITVRQYRHGIRSVTNEFPAGGIEIKTNRPLDSRSEPIADESIPIKAAIRELREETGYESDEWERVVVAPSSATVTDDYAYVFRAKNCKKAHSQDLDDTEFVNVVLRTGEEIEELISTGRFEQCVHIMAYYMGK